ncbi:Ninja family protein [Dioscorea alata]|uniref:Ninja family protein n=1 Tax=Dioscorea alata TaxID=55571 RepID=A0ACB7UWG4_DIOAL|nr:Ninja family protein [Dioscorea alata]
MEAEAAEEIERALLRGHGYSRDLLQRFGSGVCFEEPPEAARGESDEIELSLGLSLGGCLGVEVKEKKLVRSSSVAAVSMFPREQEFMVARPIERACSLPTEVEEEQRKRKEMQSLKRLEAKRKRLERRSSRSVAVAGRLRSGEGLDEDMEKLEAELGGVVNGVVPARLFGQGSIGSQGSSSSGVSDFEARTLQGLNPRNPRNTQEGNDLLSRNARPNGVSEMERSMMEEMPCVSTRGDGPNGRRVEGFLYKYRKGEEVRIVCVCHGSFLTPAEFVKHAGGGDVAHPLRQIVVNPSPSAFS